MQEIFLEEGLSSSINTIDSDFKAESIAAGLIEAGYDADKILLVRRHGDKRHVSKDIDTVQKQYSTQELMEYLYIYTNRVSIYDTIPEGIFHQPLNTAKRKTQEDVLSEIRRHREEENFARRYFQPFEMIFDQVLIDAQLYEKQFDKKNFHDRLKKIFSRYWSILHLLTLRQAVFFIKSIPVIDTTFADFTITDILMSTIMEVPVHIELVRSKPSKAQMSTANILGECRLDVDAVLGDCFVDAYRDICITIGPMQAEEMKLFESGSKNDLILKQLMQLLLPSDYRTDIKYTVLQDEKGSRFSDENHTAYLGINTILQ